MAGYEGSLFVTGDRGLYRVARPDSEAKRGDIPTAGLQAPVRAEEAAPSPRHPAEVELAEPGSPGGVGADRRARGLRAPRL